MLCGRFIAGLSVGAQMLSEEEIAYDAEALPALRDVADVVGENRFLYLIGVLVDLVLAGRSDVFRVWFELRKNRGVIVVDTVGLFAECLSVDRSVNDPEAVISSL